MLHVDWRNCTEMTSKGTRYDTEQIEEIYREVKGYQLLDDSSSSSSELSSSPILHTAKNSLRRGLLALFSAPPTIKFAKSAKRLVNFYPIVR